jgi:hypothetical protein
VKIGGYFVKKSFIRLSLCLLYFFILTGCQTNNQNNTIHTISYDGLYSGEVQHGYNIEFTVKNNKITNIKADVLEQCKKSKSSSATTVFLPGPFPIKTDGTVKAEGKDPKTKGDYRFSATFDENGSVAGTIFQEYVVSGVVCTTYNLSYNAGK